MAAILQILMGQPVAFMLAYYSPYVVYNLLYILSIKMYIYPHAEYAQYDTGSRPYT
jgi:hypothetical protein